MVRNLVGAGIDYEHPSQPCACTPLLVFKPGLAKFRFIVDLRPGNSFTVKHQFPMGKLEQILTKKAVSCFYDTFDFSYGYWKISYHYTSLLYFRSR